MRPSALNPTRRRVIPTPRVTHTAATILVLAIVGSTLASPGGSHRRHPGYVDGSRFVDFADPDGKLIEITLHGRLLHVLGERALRRHDETLAGILSGLESMHAVVAGIRDDHDVERAMREAQATVAECGKRLVDRGWERFVRVREEKGEDIQAYARMDSDDELDGVVVMGITGGRELLFVNISGDIDMDAVAALGERFGLPGLDDLPDTEEIKAQHREREKIARAEGAQTHTDSIDP